MSVNLAKLILLPRYGIKNILESTKEFPRMVGVPVARKRPLAPASADAPSLKLYKQQSSHRCVAVCGGEVFGVRTVLGPAAL